LVEHDLSENRFTLFRITALFVAVLCVMLGDKTTTVYAPRVKANIP